MINKSNLVILTVCLLASISTALRAQFSVSGEFRPRLEYRDGYAKLRDSSSTPYIDILGRNRLIFDYKSEKFTARFSIQHAYVYGENNYSSDTITKNTLNIYEGWFRYSFTKAFAIKIGRMELIYDDARLLGNSNWGPKGASHDITQLQWESEKAGYKGDFGIGINNTGPASAYLGSYPLINYKYMGYLYEQKKFFKENLIISAIAVVDVFQTSKTRSTITHDTLYVISNHDTVGTTVLPPDTMLTYSPNQLYGRLTFGGTATFTWKNLKLFASGYYQTGHLKDGRTLDAAFYGGYASYRVIKPLTLLVGYEKLTGNDYSNTDGLKTKSTSFSTLYPTTHGFYGYMDMFTAHVVSGNSAGLTDLYGRATVTLSKKTSIEATYRYFGLDHGYLEAKKSNPKYIKVDKHLGAEVDLMLLYKPIANLELNAAYCFFLPTETMERFNKLKVGTSQWAQYAYVMLTYKPNFFSSDKH